MMSMAKALSSSYLPISAVMINEKVYKVLRDNSGKIGTFGHGFTYSGHPVSAAVALETLKIYEERHIVDQVRQVAPVFQRELRRFVDHPLVGEARCIGLLGALELVRNKRTKEPFTPQQGVGVQLAKACQEQGLIIRAIADSIAFCPPLIITEVEIEEMFRRFAKGLDATWVWVREQGLAAA
jgi:4-aminobutyrate---pyruvate transaminase